MAQLTGEFPRPIAPPVWLTARARNAMHRPIFIGAVGIGSFAVALAALVLAPNQVKRIGQLAPLPVDARPDTTPFAAALAQARTRLGTAETSLTNARAHATVVRAPAVDTLGPLIKQRDSLSAVVSDLGALLTRVESAPVVASYRALAESPQLIGNVRVKSLVDSLAEVERDRDSFGTTGGADPVYVALTSRATEIGRAIEIIGLDRREALRQQITRIIAPTERQSIASTPASDTSAWIAERDSAQSLVTEASTALTQARAKVASYDTEVTRARERASLDAPPIALLGAALVFGIALGFGAAFASEIRYPRVSDEQEVERVTGARVLATVRPHRRAAGRERRAADREAPPYFDPVADSYQLTYLHVARAGASRMVLTIAGDDTRIAAVVALNVAAIAADEARSTVIVDTDTKDSPLAAAVGVAPSPGLTTVLDRRGDWADATTQVVVGRDRTIDVIPSGGANSARKPADITSLFQSDGAKLTRHYEAIITIASLAQAADGLPGVLPIPDTILCARIGHTKLATLQAGLEGIRASGGNPLGIVLWRAAPPKLGGEVRTKREVSDSKRGQSRALTGAT